MSPPIPPSHVVLVVDDEVVIRLNAAEAFRDCGCTTYEAAEADEAMQVLEAHPDISVLFTDINMPGDRDGLALAGAVHERRPDVQLILTSGRERPEQAAIPDAGQFIAKPYNLDVVTGMVAALPHKD
jgi:CheY-like chemotaxis protein